MIFFAALGHAVGGGSGAVLGVWLFKAANTLDSMVGYEDERYRDFGRASAKLDDILNFIPARIGGLVVVLAGACLGYPPVRGLHVLLRDRKKHKSPNSAHDTSPSPAAGLTAPGPDRDPNRIDRLTGSATDMSAPSCIHRKQRAFYPDPKLTRLSRTRTRSNR